MVETMPQLGPGVCFSVTFSEATNRAKMGVYDHLCGTIFTSQTMQLLGTDSYCRWLSDCEVRVCAAPDSTLALGSRLQFQPIVAVIDRSGPTLRQELTVVQLDNPTKPIPLIRAQGLATCGRVVLDGSYSIPAVFNRLTYNWSILSSASVTEDLRVKTVLAEANAANSAVVTFADDDLPASVAFTFRLTVTNVVGGVDFVDHTIVKSSSPAPDSYIQGPPEVSMVVSEQYTFLSSARISDCSNNMQEQFAYLWTLMQSEGNGSDVLAAEDIDANGPTLVLPENLLSPSEQYIVMLTVRSSNGFESSSRVLMSVLDGPILATILGGHRTVSRSDELTLNGEAIDMTLDSTEFVYHWNCTFLFDDDDCDEVFDACTSVTGEVLLLPDGSGPIANDGVSLTIPEDILPLRRMRFIFTASKGSRAGTGTADITVTASPTLPFVPRINLPPAEEYPWNDRIVVVGQCNDEEDIYGFVWSANFDVSISPTGTEGKNFVIAPFTLNELPYFDYSLELRCFEEDIPATVVIPAPTTTPGTLLQTHSVSLRHASFHPLSLSLFLAFITACHGN